MYVFGNLGHNFQEDNKTHSSIVSEYLSLMKSCNNIKIKYAKKQLKISNLLVLVKLIQTFKFLIKMYQ